MGTSLKAPSGLSLLYQCPQERPDLRDSMRAMTGITTQPSIIRNATYCGGFNRSTSLARISPRGTTVGRHGVAGRSNLANEFAVYFAVYLLCRYSRRQGAQDGAGWWAWTSYSVQAETF
jgi:hypothetical protein